MDNTYDFTSLIRSAGELDGACRAHSNSEPELIKGLCGRPSNGVRSHTKTQKIGGDLQV